MLFSRLFTVTCASVLTAMLAFTAEPGRAGDGMDGTDHSQHVMPAAGDDPHAAHRHMMANNDIRRSVVSYTIPTVELTRDDGRRVTLQHELDDGRPVVLNFIYTTCTTICPLTSQVFGVIQSRLGANAAKVHLVSISIDPEQDTPARLREYASRFHAGAAWQHYTGTVTASATAQQAFGVYRGDKMSHLPVTLVRTAPGASWVRLDGFATAADVLAELGTHAGAMQASGQAH